jgi:hypothetical protein
MAACRLRDRNRSRGQRQPRLQDPVRVARGLAGPELNGTRRPNRLDISPASRTKPPAPRYRRTRRRQTSANINSTEPMPQPRSRPERTPAPWARWLVGQSMQSRHRRPSNGARCGVGEGTRR